MAINNAVRPIANLETVNETAFVNQKPIKYIRRHFMGTLHILRGVEGEGTKMG